MDEGTFGDLQTDDWQNGRMVVLRRLAEGEKGAERVPTDPSMREVMRGAQLVAMVVVLLGLITLLGGVRLIQVGQLILGIAVAAIGLVLTVGGAIPALGIPLIRRRRARYVILAPEVASEFRVAMQEERRSVGHRPEAWEMEAGAEKLWARAIELAEAGR